MMLGILCMMAAAVYANTELAPDGEVKIEAAELAQAEKTKTAAVELARVEETKTAAVELARAEETKTAAVELAQAEGTKTEETELKQTEETQTGAIELKQTEEIQTGKIALFPVGQSHVWEDVRYYDEGVDGVIEEKPQEAIVVAVGPGGLVGNVAGGRTGWQQDLFTGHS